MRCFLVGTIPPANTALMLQLMLSWAIAAAGWSWASPAICCSCSRTPVPCAGITPRRQGFGSSQIPCVIRSSSSSSSSPSSSQRSLFQGGGSNLEPLTGLDVSAETDSNKDSDCDNAGISSDNYGDWLFESRTERVIGYASLAFLETMYWYWWAPGIDPNSRWFNPSDGELISCLLTPSIALAPPVGSGLGFSSLLLNSFLILPAVWAILLLQEGSGSRLRQGTMVETIRVLACAAGFLVGGGALVPFMMLRQPLPSPWSISREGLPAPLRWFEPPLPREVRDESPSAATTATVTVTSILPASLSLSPSPGAVLLVLLAAVVLATFLVPLAHSDWIVEGTAFWNRATSSQFTSLALVDSAMISIAVLDPIMDDALRRGYVHNPTTEDGSSFSWRSWRKEHRTEAIRKLAAFVAVPFIGPVAWICLRPGYPPTSGSVKGAQGVDK